MSKVYKSITEIPNYQTVKKIEAANNKIQSLEGLEKNSNITFLNLNKNEIKEIGKHLVQCKNLIVLNLGNNQISVIKGIHNQKELKALILNNNQITTISGLDGLNQINTLIISHNKLNNIDNIYHVRTSLLKLNISHNQLKSLNGVEKLKELKELKANDNQISSIPEKIQALSKLSILDLGRNHFKDIKKIKPLNSLKKLVNLNFSGNQLELTQDMLKTDFPNLKLKLLNNKKLDDGKLHGDVYKEKVKLNKQAYKGIITKEQAEQEFQKLQKEKEQQRKEKNKKRKEKLLQKQNIVQKQHLINPDESIKLKTYENETQLEKLNEISINNKQQNKNQKQDKDVIKTNVGITRVEHNKKQTKANQKQEKKLKIVKADIFSEKKEDNVAGWDD